MNGNTMIMYKYLKGGIIMKININNKEKIEAALNEVQSRAKARTISYEDILEAIDTIEEKLNISKKAMVGVIARVSLHCEHFAGSYKGVPMGTEFTIQRFSSGWFLTKVDRYNVDHTRTYRLTLSESAKAAILENASELNL